MKKEQFIEFFVKEHRTLLGMGCFELFNIYISLILLVVILPFGYLDPVVSKLDRIFPILFFSSERLVESEFIWLNLTENV